MPYIEVKVTAAPDAQLSRRIARGVADLTARHLGKDPSVTSVLVDFIDAARWHVGAEPVAAQGAATYWLDLKITEGTNTKRELAAYLRAVHAMMADLLGGVVAASYVLVHHAPASHWGYGGRTQEFRFIASQDAEEVR